MVASAERQKLSDAIEAQTLASQRLDEAQVAAANARSKWSAANSNVGVISAQIEEGEENAEDSSDAFVSSLASGADLSVLDKPKTHLDDLRAQLAEAEGESARWRDALKTAEEAVEVRRKALDMAAFFVDSAARAVMSAEVNFAALLSATEALRSELLDAQARLAALARVMDNQSDARKTIVNFLSDGWLLYSPWRDRAAAGPIKDAFAKLKSNASTSLKIREIPPAVTPSGTHPF